MGPSSCFPPYWCVWSSGKYMWSRFLPPITTKREREAKGLAITTSRCLAQYCTWDQCRFYWIRTVRMEAPLVRPTSSGTLNIKDNWLFVTPKEWIWWFITACVYDIWVPRPHVIDTWVTNNQLPIFSSGIWSNSPASKREREIQKHESRTVPTDNMLKKLYEMCYIILTSRYIGPSTVAK